MLKRQPLAGILTKSRPSAQPLTTPNNPATFVTWNTRTLSCISANTSSSLRKSDLRPLFSRTTNTFRIPNNRYSSFAQTRALSQRRNMSTLPRLPVFQAIAGHDPASTAVIHSHSQRKFTYGELLHDVAETAEKLVKENGGKGLEGERVAFLVENGYDYVVTWLAIMAAHAIAVPMSPAFPAHELQYIMDHSQARLLLASSKFAKKAQDVLDEGLECSPKLVAVEKKKGGLTDYNKIELEGSEETQGGMMLYTSGTTNRPKGVLLPLPTITAQSHSLLTAWHYTPTDHLLHILPLHHIHGTINAILTPLFAGSTIEFLFPFNAQKVWERLGAPFLSSPPAEAPSSPKTPTSPSAPLPKRSSLNSHPTNRPKFVFSEEKPKPITFLTAVPTVYSRLLATHKDLDEPLQEATKKAISPSNLRLNISGSAALPTPTKSAWTTLSSGNILLERYGMTEVGMALSCGLPTSTRIDGSVGFPLPSVQVRLVDTETNSVIPVDSAKGVQEASTKQGEHGSGAKAGKPERDGEIQLRGPTIFAQYWRNPEATEKEFVHAEKGDTDQGKWFRTGDVAVRRNVESVLDGKEKGEHAWITGPAYFIHGRKSADIIKTGGEKVSALEVEREILSLPEISECAVVAVPSGKWGQKVGAVLVVDQKAWSEKGGDKEYGPMDLRRALRDRVVNYKIPQVVKLVEGIPRNAMGKVNKKTLVREVFGDEFSGDEA